LSAQLARPILFKIIPDSFIDVFPPASQGNYPGDVQRLEFKIIKADSKAILIMKFKLKEIYLIRFQRIKSSY